MELPQLDVLKEKNVFTGSQGDFRFKIMPGGEQIEAVAYHTFALEICRENGMILGVESFPVTPEGMQEMESWLKKQAAAFESAQESDKTEKSNR